MRVTDLGFAVCVEFPTAPKGRRPGQPVLLRKREDRGTRQHQRQNAGSCFLSLVILITGLLCSPHFPLNIYIVLPNCQLPTAQQFRRPRTTRTVTSSFTTPRGGLLFHLSARSFLYRCRDKTVKKTGVPPYLACLHTPKTLVIIAPRKVPCSARVRRFRGFN